MRLLSVVLGCVLGLAGCGGPRAEAPADAEETVRIRPWVENPRYWQYRGKPDLLLGGTKDDNLFQIPDLEEHLDLLASVGGNYIRNTMSDRNDHGYEVHAFARRSDGKYDLDGWNQEYWERFRRLLMLTGERNIIVQIEVWDRFDHSRDNWLTDPYRPSNNINYTGEETGLDEEYPDHPAQDKQTFFHSIPGMEGYTPGLDKVRHYQERFVAKILSYSLEFPNVLYCMDNETSTDPVWGQYWMKFISDRARRKGVDVFVTDMFDDAWKAEESAKLRQAIDHPSLYTFIDVSQVNSRNFGEEHWRRIHWVIEQVKVHPRPVNHVKIYSDGNSSWGSGTPKDGIERFWRNLIAGSASARFHRNGAGIGLRPIAQACIRAARKVESVVKFWDVEARMDLLGDREENEAYLAAKPGEAYILFFTDGGAVRLDLNGHPGKYRLRWVDVRAGEWGGEEMLDGGSSVPVSAPADGPWVAAIRSAGK